MKILIIGDVHGSYDALRILLRKAKWIPEEDELWFTGDLIGRGSQSLDVLRFVYALGRGAKLVLGNHELRLLATRFADAPVPQDLAKICDAPDYERLSNWLSQQPFIRQDEKRQLLLVHAGLIPNWSLTEILAAAGRLQEMLICRTSEMKAFLQWPRSTKKPFVFAAPHAGASKALRLEYAMTALTKIRFCNSRGDLNLKKSGPPHTAKLPWRPWYEVYQPFWRNYTIFFGHWAAAAGALFPKNIIGLDTGYIWGRQLSAWNLEEQQFIRVTPQEVAQDASA